MAGSWGHIVADDGRFRGTELIENLGDAYEALEECYGIVMVLSGGDQEQIADAARRYKEGVRMGGSVPYDET